MSVSLCRSQLNNYVHSTKTHEYSKSKLLSSADLKFNDNWNRHEDYNNVGDDIDDGGNK